MGLRVAIALLCLACASLLDEHASGHGVEPAQRRVFIAGDSTASEYGPERAPRQGWGMQLQSFLDPQAWSVRNHAQSGRSSRSFIEQGWLDGIAKDLRRGDVLLVQFGHNDEKVEDPTRYNEPREAFPAWLMRYVALARERGATLVHMTIRGHAAIGWRGPADFVGLRCRIDGFTVGFLGRFGVTLDDYRRIAGALRVIPHAP